MLNLDRDAPIVGMIARLQRWKGVHLLIEALPQVRASFPESIAVIVGGAHFAEPDYEAYLKTLANRLGVGENVVFAGLRSDIPIWLSAMNVVAHPADNQPFGLAIVEAMALGKPVVASDSGGPLEIIEPARAGCSSGQATQATSPPACAESSEIHMRQPCSVRALESERNSFRRRDLQTP